MSTLFLKKIKFFQLLEKQVKLGSGKEENRPKETVQIA